MENNFKKAKSIFHVVLLLLAIIFWGLLLNYKCIGCNLDKEDSFEIIFQYINATSGGSLIIMSILFVGIIMSEELERKTQLAVSYSAALLHLLALPTLYAEYTDHTKETRMLVAIIFCAVIAVIHFTEAICLSVKKKEIRQGEEKGLKEKQ